MIHLEAIKCKHCGSMLPTVPPPSMRPMARASESSVQASWIDQNKRRLYAGAAGAIALIIVLAVMVAWSKKSPAVGILALVVTGVIIASVVAGRYVQQAPRWLAGLSKWFLGHKLVTFLPIAVVALGAASGLSARAKLNAACDDRMALASAKKKQGRPPSEIAAAFSDAVSACDRAGRSTERQTAYQESVTANSQAEKQLQEEKAQRYASAVADARKQASAGSAEAAVTSFRSAQKNGQLTADDKRLFAVQLRDRGRELVALSAWSDAVALLTEAQREDPGLDGVKEPLEVAQLAVRKAEVQRAVIQATDVANDTRCNDPDALTTAWNQLRDVRKGDPLYSHATVAAKALDKCRKATLKILVDAVRDIMKAQREQMVRDYETRLLDKGMDVRVRLSGKRKDRITITYVLFNRAWAHQITDGGSMNAGSFLATLQDAGFVKVVFSDGWSESYFYDLDPISEIEAAKATGLVEPFKL